VFGCVTAFAYACAGTPAREQRGGNQNIRIKKTPHLLSPCRISAVRALMSSSFFMPAFSASPTIPA